MSLAPLDMSVRASDGITLKGVLTYPAAATGRLFPLAVLAHQYPGTRDTFAPLVADFLGLGVATLAFDLRGHGASIVGSSGPVVVDTPEGFTSEAFGRAFMASASAVGFHRIDNDVLRVASWGAVQNFVDPTRLLLVGASVGGSGALLAAPDIPGLRAAITLGAAGAPVFGADGADRVRAAVERLRVPVHLASSQDDAFDGAANAARWSEGLAHASATIVPGAAHAMAIYGDVRDALLATVRQALGEPQ